MSFAEKHNSSPSTPFDPTLAAGAPAKPMALPWDGLSGTLWGFVKRIPLGTSARSFALWCVITSLLSAFLVFQIQPVIGKMILPWFGGTPAVWTTCILFFQLLLLAGYGYAYTLNWLLKPKWQALVHLTLVVTALSLLPISPDDAWKPSNGLNPTGRILTLLLAHVGLPYFLLSATAPLLQAWFAAVHPHRTPYRLYAWSNVGSLTALLSFPFVVEPLFTTRTQGYAWSAGFVGFAVLCIFLMIPLWRGLAEQSGLVAQSDGPTGGRAAASVNRSMRSKKKSRKSSRGCGKAEELATHSPASGLANVFVWLTLSAFGSMALVAVTNLICQEISVVPLLWVLPLSIYLVTFIISFGRPQWFVRRWWGLVAVLAVLTTVLYRGDYLGSLDRMSESVLYCIVLFLICMVCHGELVRRRPEPERLTLFYFALAGGGALGSLFVALVCPLVFSTYFETDLTLAAGLAVAVWLVVEGGRHDWPFGKTAHRGAGGLLAAAGVLWIVAGALFAEDEYTAVQLRNFYGVLSVERAVGRHLERGLAFYHGHTLHGFQYLRPDLRRTPTTYYDPASGVGLALSRRSRQKPLRVGIVGLGVGTVAAYSRPGDLYHFYEIDRDVIKLARDCFTYLEDAPAEIKITLGDARVALERQSPRNFDVLILDAFSGDAIPTHLLTLEAFDLYRKHLRPGGIIAVHVSNRYLNLETVVGAAAERNGWLQLYVERTHKTESRADAESDWYLLTRNEQFVQDPVILKRAVTVPPSSHPTVWTDKYSSIFSVWQ